MFYKLDNIKTLTYTAKDNSERIKKIRLLHLKNDMFHIVVCFYNNEYQFEEDIKYMKRLCLNEVRRSTNAVNLKQKKCFKFLMDCGFDFLNDFWGREITSSDHVEEFFKNHFFGVPSINSIFNLTLVEASEINFGKFVSCNVMNVSTTPSTDNGDNDDDYPEECSDEERTRRAYYRGFKDVSLLERFYRGMNGETE